MSAKARKKSAAKPRKPARSESKPEETPRPVFQKPKAQAPRALVSSRHDVGMVERAARGFSLGELQAAGLNLGTARRLGLSVDARRRTTIGKNVESLKGWSAPRKQPPAPKPAAKEAPAPAEPVKKPRRAPAKKTK